MLTTEAQYNDLNQEMNIDTIPFYGPYSNVANHLTVVLTLVQDLKQTPTLHLIIVAPQPFHFGAVLSSCFVFYDLDSFEEERRTSLTFGLILLQG